MRGPLSYRTAAPHALPRDVALWCHRGATKQAFHVWHTNTHSYPHLKRIHALSCSPAASILFPHPTTAPMSLSRLLRESIVSSRVAIAIASLAQCGSLYICRSMRSLHPAPLSHPSLHRGCAAYLLHCRCWRHCSCRALKCPRPTRKYVRNSLLITLSLPLFILARAPNPLPTCHCHSDTLKALQPNSCAAQA